MTPPRHFARFGRPKPGGLPPRGVPRPFGQAVRRLAWIATGFAGLSTALFTSDPAHADRLVDVSASKGINLRDFTYGLAWNDFDSDGRRDLFVCRHFDPPVIYRGLSNGNFSSVFNPTLFAEGDHHGQVIADFDNDGDSDIYLTGGAEGGTGNIPKHFYRNDGAFQFVDIAAAAGLEDGTGRGRSCSAIDVNADGWLDVFVAKSPRLGVPNALYLNDGAGHYTDIAASAGVADAFGSVGGVFGDYDRDGDADLFVSGEETDASESRLYRNNGNLTFTNVTSTMLPGLGKVAAAAWADFDKDGDLDLALGLGDEALFDGAERISDKITFFMNAREDENGIDGIDFTTNASSVSFSVYSAGVFDSTTVFIGANAVNPTTSPFSLTAAQAAGQPPFTVGTSTGLFIWTVGNSWKVRGIAPPAQGYNYGGLIDATSSISSHTTSDFEAYTHGTRGTRLYRNDGTLFRDVTLDFDITDAVNVRNLTWVDYDRDGDLDLHVLGKGDAQTQNEPDLLYRNRGTYFTDETSDYDAEGPTQGIADACAWDDYDNDGDLDVAILSGAPPRAYAVLENDRLYRNDTASRNEIRVNLVGTVSNRDGLGAWVTCVSSYAGTQSHYVTANSWRGGQVMTDAYFALRWDTVVNLLRVEWPSGIVNEFTNVPHGDVTVTEANTALDVAPLATGEAAALSLRVVSTPSVSSVSFEFLGDRAGEANLEIFDARGRRVLRTFVPAAQRSFTWNGVDHAGKSVGQGVYYGVLTEGLRQSKAKVVLLR